MNYKKIKTINSHSGLARFLAECSEEPETEIPTPREIPSPYHFSSTVAVYRHDSGRLVFWRETRHRHFEVFAVTDPDIDENGLDHIDRAEIYYNVQ